MYYRNFLGLAVADLNMGARIEVVSTGQVFEDTVSSAVIHPSDDRFLIFKPVEQADGQISIVLNWFEELTRLVPIEK